MYNIFTFGCLLIECDDELALSSGHRVFLHQPTNVHRLQFLLGALP